MGNVYVRQFNSYRYKLELTQILIPPNLKRHLKNTKLQLKPQHIHILIVLITTSLL